MRKSRWQRRLLFVLLLGVAALLVWCATLYFIIAGYEGESEATLPQVDVGIVLGARLWDDRPSPGLQERLDHALALYRAGKFGHFIVTGGLDAGGATITEAEGMRNYLVGQGVPETAILTDPDSYSTLENLQNASALMENENWQTAVVVTHSYHGSRAADIADEVGLDPVLVSVTDSHVLNMPYHKSREVLAYTKWLLVKWFQ